MKQNDSTNSAEERYLPGTRIVFHDCADQIVHKIIPNCKLPGDICSEFEGRVYSFDKEFLDEHVRIFKG